MKYLLVAMIVFYVLTFVTYKSANKSGDDFGAAVFPLFCAAVSVVLTVVYLALALWLHRML